MLPIAVDGKLPAYLAVRCQVHSQEGSHFQLHLIIALMYAPECLIQRFDDLQAPGGMRVVACVMQCVACSRQGKLAEIMMLVDKAV